MFPDFKNSYPKESVWHFDLHFVLNFFLRYISDNWEETKQHWRIGWRFSIWRCERTPIKTAEFESRNTLNTILLIGMSSTFMKTTLHCQNLDIFWADLKNLTFFSMVTVTHHLSLSQGRKGIYGCWYLAFSVFCWWHFVPGLAVCILVHKDMFKTDIIRWYTNSLVNATFGSWKKLC